MSVIDKQYVDCLDLMEKAIADGISFDAIGFRDKGTGSFIRKRKQTITKRRNEFSDEFKSRYQMLLGQYELAMQTKNKEVQKAKHEERPVITKKLSDVIGESNRKMTQDDISKIKFSMIEEQVRNTGLDMDSINIKKVNIWGSLDNPQVSVGFVPKPLLEQKNFKDVAAEFVNEMANRVHSTQRPFFKPFNINTRGKSKMLSIPTLFDEHFGKYCSRTETGEAFDLDIATKRHFGAIEHFLSEMERYPEIERILFPIGNDLFNSDTPQNTTSAGTPQDEHKRWKETFKVVEDVFVKTINMIGERYPIDVYTIPGNHDMKNVFVLGRVLSAFYHSNQGRININPDGNDEMSRRYYKYGKNGLSFSHGDGEKVKDVVNIFNYAFPQMFPDNYYEAIHKYHFQGHLHVERQYIVDDRNGFKIYNVPSMTGTDFWHDHKGYIGSKKMSQCFLVDKENGMANVLNYHVSLK